MRRDKRQHGPLGRMTEPESNGSKAAVNAQNFPRARRSANRCAANKATPAGRRSVTAASATTAITAAATTTAVAASAASATAAATTTAAAAVATTTAAAALFTRAGFVNCEAPTVELPLVKPLDCCLCLSVVVHLDKTKALAPARRAILDHLRLCTVPNCENNCSKAESLTP